MGKAPSTLYPKGRLVKMIYKFENAYDDQTGRISTKITNFPSSSWEEASQEIKLGYEKANIEICAFILGGICKKSQLGFEGSIEWFIKRALTMKEDKQYTPIE